MITIYFKTIRDSQFQEIHEFRVGSLIYVKEATLEDLAQVAQFSGCELTDIRDSLDKHEVPRIEREAESVILFTRHPGEQQELGLYTNTLTILLTNSSIVVISPGKSAIIENLFTAQNNQLTTTQKSKLLLFILLRITQEFTASIKRVRQSILGQEESHRLIDNDSIVKLTKNEEILNQYLTSLVPMRNLLETLATGRYVNLYEKDYDLLQDLMIAIRQSEEICQVNIKSIRSLRNSYQILFTNDVNKTIKRLTALTIIFNIPTMIASFYGMNIPIPFQKANFIFPFTVLLSLGLCLIAILIFIRKRWL